MSSTHARLCNGGERGGGDKQQRHRSDRSRVRYVRPKGACRQCSNYLNLECRREADDAASLRSYRLLRTALVHAYNQATENMIFQNLSCLRLARVALCTRGVFVHEPGEVAWPISKDSAPRAPFFPLDTPTALANKARWMKPALISDGGIDLALQTFDEFLSHMIRRLYGLDNADKQKNITNTTCCIQRIQIQSYTSTRQRRKHADMLCVLVAWYPTAKQQPKSHDNSEIKSEHLRCTAWGSSLTPAATS